MKFEKVTELCKKSRKFLIFKYSEKIYFLGTGNAMFVVPDGTICTPEYLTSFAGLKPLEVDIICHKAGRNRPYAPSG